MHILCSMVFVENKDRHDFLGRVLVGDDEGHEKVCWNAQELEADAKLGRGWTAGVLGSGAGEKECLPTRD
jgi:hypothetical protein